MQPLTRTRAVRGPFDYAVPPSMAAEVGVGTLLRVPFARRRALGVVVALAAESELAPERLAEPERVIGTGLTPELVALAEWMAREYCSTPARALSLMLPPGAAAGRGAKRALMATLTAEGAAALGERVGSGVGDTLTAAPASAVAAPAPAVPAPAAPAPAAPAPAAPASVPAPALAAGAGHQTEPEVPLDAPPAAAGDAGHQTEPAVPLDAPPGPAAPAAVGPASAAPGPAAPGPGAPRLTDAQRALLTELARRGGGAIAAELGTEALRRLERRGFVTIAPRIIPRRPANLIVGRADAAAPSLTADQRAAVGTLLAALHAGPVTGGTAPATGGTAPATDVTAPATNGTAPATGGTGTAREGLPARFLLQGVTGSGKTEVYLAAVQAALDLGRTAIVLVPEIALTPQALGRFQARFGDIVAVLHSALSDGERHDEWMRLRAGEARVCVGPRSAILAPLRNIGLIVVDEEHESSYKHEGDPRYDARGIALWRAAYHGATLVFGSATPRPETVTEMRRLSLPHRVDGRAMPPVQMLDMRECHHPLHPETRMALADLRQSGGKAIMLLNRRGWSNFLSCRSCGHVWLCPNCEVALVLHGAPREPGRAGHAAAPRGRAAAPRGHVACHHCGHREPVPERCTECASVSVARHGAGTERIEHELRDALGTARFPVFRLDAGAASLEARARTLQAFEHAPAGVLVGTQMVAKGHDFPDVSLGIVLDADQTLRFPDFRAEERTFALVTQLAGRIGRAGRADGAAPGRPAPLGRVLVQTLAPDARPLAYAARHDSDGFLQDELTRRRALSYPPYASLIRVICSSEEEAPAREASEAIHSRLVDGSAMLL
ncbi:MAG TPA: primosomal protein N', partial [Solirubrobacteraceae bacterium]|nr:primosomal protein N' [Solirubrobacteraceae bacterium]